MLDSLLRPYPGEDNEIIGYSFDVSTSRIDLDLSEIDLSFSTALLHIYSELFRIFPTGIQKARRFLGLLSFGP